MQVFQVICYALAALCFLFAFVRHVFEPVNLDFIALGLFFVVIPILTAHIGHIT